MVKKKGYYIVDGAYVELPKDRRGLLRFFCVRFFSGVVMWFIPWFMIAIASFTTFKQFGFLCYSLTTMFFFESFYLYHILRETRNGQGYFFVFSIVMILLFVCFM